MLTPGATFSSVLHYDQSFARYKLPRIELEHNCQIYSVITLNTIPWGSHFTPFHLTMAPFWGNCSFGLPYALQWRTWNFRKKNLQNWKLKISQTVLFTWPKSLPLSVKMACVQLSDPWPPGTLFVWIYEPGSFLLRLCLSRLKVSHQFSNLMDRLGQSPASLICWT